MKKSRFTGNKREILQVCEEFSLAYEEITEWTFNHFLKQPALIRIMDSQEDQRFALKENEKELYEILFNHLSDFLVLCSPKQIASFSAAFRDVVDEDALPALKYWKENPFFWSAFYIEERFGDNMFTIVDIFTHERSLLVSQNLSELVAHTKNDRLLYYSMMFSNGMCLQTAGIPLSASLSAHDVSLFFSFFNLFDTSIVTKETITKDILLHYFEFALIMLHSIVPSMVMGGYEVDYAFSVHKVDKSISNVCKASSSLSFVGRYKESDSYAFTTIPLDIQEEFLHLFPASFSYFDDMNQENLKEILSPTLYIDKKGGEIFISCLNIMGYHLMRLFVESVYPLATGKIYGQRYSLESTKPFNDMVHMHHSLFFSINKYYDSKLFPWIKYTEFGQEKGKQDSVSNEDMNPINNLLKAIGDAHNHGREIDIKTLAKKFNIPLDTAKSIQKMAMKQISKHGPSPEAVSRTKEFPLQHVASFSPSVRKVLMNPTIENEIINITSKQDSDLGQDALHLMNSLSSREMKEYVKESDFDEAVEYLSYDVFSEHLAPIIVNSVIYIMSKEGDTWVDVRAIVANIFSNFEHSITQEYSGYTDVLTDVSSFIYTQLCAAGLFELKERVNRVDRVTGHYCIKRNLLFTTLFFIDEKMNR